jgi:hypothetical protein
MMKKLYTYLMTLVLMASTIGINVNSHYCSGEYVGSIVNGFTFVTEQGEAMQGCMEKENDCPHCKNVKHCYRILSQFMKGQVAQTQPVVVQPDWFHAAFEQQSIPQPIVCETESTHSYYYTPPPLPDVLILNKGLRAPPRFS